jgi:putative heme-binding domain-containing protein
MNHRKLSVTLLGLAVLLLGVLSLRSDVQPADSAKGERPYGLSKRTPWTTSRLKGTPEPPHPYRIERAFPKLTFKDPLLLVRLPGSGRFFVGEQAGKLYSFPIDSACDRADLFLDLTTELKSWDKDGPVKGVSAVYGLAFHPRFAENRYCYICYILASKKRGEELPDGTRVSRFRVTETDPPRIDPASEKVLITWLSGGHNGCDLHFGPDGYLYISTGDATSPNPPDALDTGQDLSDLLGSILRIDVDREDKGQAYAVPADNPFVKLPGARPEIWAYGFRNPWRMSFDRATGDLWVGDVGWELWEMVYRIQKGGNYGWPVMEGPQPVKPEGKRGPTPILPPALAFPHTEAASITGGYVYRGQRFKELIGAYICGDWVTRKFWATKFEGDRVVWHKELAQGAVRVVAFGEDKDGELYFLHHDDVGTIHQLVPNEKARDHRDDFPRKLSETGLFASVQEQTPAPGVLPFSVNAEQWADHATAEHFVALPGQTAARIYDSPVRIPGGFFSGEVFFPADGVLAKTISLELERGNPKSRRRLETQVLHHDGETWRGYSYRWNDEQTGAVLVGAGGADRTVTVTDAKAPGGKYTLTWHYPSRTECLTCHNPWTGYTLAFTLPQLNRDHDYGGVVDNQLRTLRHVGLVTLLHNHRNGSDTTLRDLPSTRLTDPHDASAGLDERARSYLHVNCAHCHQFGAGGTADIDLRFGTALGQTKALAVPPVQGAFNIRDAHILSPGDPYRSVLYYRMAKLGRGRMPHLGSEIVDERGLRLMHDWIRQMPAHQDARALLDQLRTPDRRAAAIKRLLSATSSALMLAHELEEGKLSDAVRSQVLAAAMALPDPQVRDLFERFVPDDQRVKRLGNTIKPEAILTLKGNADRGRELFFKSAGLRCAACHRVGDTGSTLGPELNQIGKKYTRAQLLESLLEPSKLIEPKYVTYVAATTDGKLHTGVLVEKTEREMVLRTADDKEVRLRADKVLALEPQRTSLMPEQLLRDLTAEQAADLVEFLASLK